MNAKRCMWAAIARGILLVGGVIAVGCSEKKDDRALVTQSPVQNKFTDRPALRFGVLPATDDQDIQQDYRIMLEELGKILRRPVQLDVATDYDDLVARLTAEKVQMAQLSAYLYVRAKPAMRADVVVQQRMAWDTEYRGVIVTKNDAPFKSLKSLNQKRFAYVDEHSSAGYFYPRMSLRAEGIDPEIFFKRTVFAGSHKRVAELIRTGEVDAGAMSEQTLSEFLFLRVLAKTDPIPDDVIVASNNPSLLSEAERAQLREFFLKAHREPRMYNFMNQRGIETFISPSLDVYAPLEKELGLSTTVTAKPGKDDEAKADEAAPTPRRGAGKQGL